MPADLSPTADLSSAKKRPKDLRHASKFGKFSASAYERFRAVFARSGKSQPGASSSQSNTSQAAVVVDHHERSSDRDSRIASTVSLPGARNQEGLSPFEDPTRFQNSVLPSDLDTAQPPNQIATSTFSGARDFSISGNAQVLNVGSMINQYTGTYGLENIKEFVSFDALYDSSVQDPQRKCHPGTRESILKQMHDWIDNPNPTQRILWLHGPAGVGKSAIAQTIARSYGSSKAAAATFFFFRSDASRSDGHRLFPTIAWQLAKSIPGARNSIADALNDDSDIPRKNIEDQFQYLIAQPFRSITEATSQAQIFMPVVIIDGIDECSDEKLQQRLINILGEAVSDHHIPLRFLLSSRPEALIKEAFEPFRGTTLQIDLATADEAYRDVEKYLKAEFRRIASKQGINADTWPGEGVIRDLTSRSSGQFVYASTVIKFVGDEYDSAPSQLDIILGLEPSDGKAPFAELDTLYLEILRRQRGQEFLNDFLALLLAKCDYQDYGLLLKIGEKAVIRKLRGMHSVLKIEPEFDVHHRSFLDFLQDSARSRQYYLTKQTATRRYLDFIVESLVRYTTKLIEQPDYHGNEHFAPKFGGKVRGFPRWIGLPLRDWEEASLPIFRLKDELLKSPELCPSWKRGFCDECTALYIIDALLLHVSFYRGISSNPTMRLPQGEHEPSGDLPSTVVEDQRIFEDLDECLSLLFLVLGNGQLAASEIKTAMRILCVLLRFDPAKTALKIQIVSDAQNLINFLYYAINNDKLRWAYEASRQAAVLAMEVYARAPLLPHLFLDGTAITMGEKIGTLRYKGQYQGKSVVIKGCGKMGINSLSQTALIFGTVSHENIPSLLGIYEKMSGHRFTFVFSYEANYSLRHWRHNLNPSLVEIQKRLFEVAKALEYMRSLGFVPDYELTGANIDLDHSSCIQLPFYWLSIQYRRKTPPHHTMSNINAAKDFHTFERGVFMFGCLFYEILFDTNISSGDHHRGNSTIVKERPGKPKIDETVWNLIKQCCADDPMERPTMAQVVAEMGSWKSA